MPSWKTKRVKDASPYPMGANEKNVFKMVVILIFITFIPLLLFPANPIDVEELEKQITAPGISQKEKLRLLVQLSEFTQDSEPVKAVKYGKEALEMLNLFNDPSLEVRVLLSLTWAAQNIGQYESALEYGYKAETLALDIGDKRAAAVAYNHIGRIYEQLGFLDRSLDYVLRALKLFEELGDKKNTAEAYKNIGNIFQELKDSRQAMEHYLKSLQISETLGDKKNIARILNNIGKVYSESDQLNKALEYYQKSLAIVEELNWQIGQIVGRGNIATVYSKKGEAARSLEYNLKTLEICKKIGQKRFIAILLSNIAVDYRLLGQYKKALRYIYQALDIAREIKNKDIIRNFYEELFYIYEAMKNYEQAFFYFKEYKKTNDEIFSKECQKNISQLWLKFKTEKKEEEIQQLTKDNRIQQLKLERQELVRNFLIVVSLLIFVLAIVTYNRYRTKKKAERLLKESERKLRAMNTAKDKLFSIIAHDLESPLNGLLLSTGYLEKKYHTLEEQDIKGFHHQIYENASHMAKLLDNLLQWAASQLGKLEVEPEIFDLNPLTGDTITLIDPSARDKNIRLMSHINENTLAWADKRMVETVMRNLVSNAVKYSNTGGEVHITSTAREKFLEVAVADNGVGIPGEKLESLFDPSIHNSTRGTAGERGIGLGLVLCKEFVEKNGGTIRAEGNNGTDANTGTRMVFTLPVPPAQYRESSLTMNNE
jgi:signal transduction histidine kinase